MHLALIKGLFIYSYRAYSLKQSFGADKGLLGLQEM